MTEEDDRITFENAKGCFRDADGTVHEFTNVKVTFEKDDGDEGIMSQDIAYAQRQFHHEVMRSASLIHAMKRAMQEDSPKAIDDILSSGIAEYEASK